MSLKAFSYIRRGGRMTKSQQRGFEQHLPTFQLSLEELASLSGAKPLGLEIGFGMGQALLSWAEQAPDWNLLGVELYRPGVGALADQLAKQEIANVSIVTEPAQEVVAHLQAAVLGEVRIFFPDPWHKKRHAKRRLIQPDFVAQLRRTMAPKAKLHLATDWSPYAEWMREVMQAASGFELHQDSRRAADEQAQIDRQLTKFERRGEKLGHDIQDLIYLAV